MNSYPTNPLAPEYHQVQTGIMDRKGQHWLDENDVSHTSMSMGDMVMTERTVDSTDGPVTIRKFLYCQSNGWKQFDLV
ncbi:hypothetical protein N9E35_01415 [Candidatus Marinimicrobia bacterium]|nr:hypothetical protein [Candidatus Neomarinimicrobiota bacterium]